MVRVVQIKFPQVFDAVQEFGHAHGDVMVTEETDSAICDSFGARKLEQPLEDKIGRRRGRTFVNLDD